MRQGRYRSVPVESGGGGMHWDLSRIAFIGNYLPRICGIATFTKDLCEAVARETPKTTCAVVAMNDVVEGYDYPPRVRFQINQSRLDEYQNAADFLNMTNNDVVCVQHEYGIFGGPAGGFLLALLRELRIPIVSTLHTVLAEPNSEQRSVLEELAKLSDRLVVMGNKGAELLREVYAVPEEKIVFIHHGVPDVPFMDANFFKDLFGVEGRRVVLTFGLLSPDKGIENAINALPEVVKRHPDVVYVILGATHPQVLKEKGEEHLFFLQRLVRERGLSESVMFHNRFVSAEELHSFIGCADICVTPYLHEAQVTSGTLALYLGSGKAVVSTPYWHAAELLAGGRGLLVPFGDTGALAEALVHLLDHEVERHAMRKRAYNFGRQMIWREIARRYLEVFAQVRQERGRIPRKMHQAPSGADGFPRKVPALEFGHMRRMTDCTGIIQHAKYTIPNRFHGYCTDDNARALIVAVRALRLQGEEADGLKELAPVYLSFLDHAFEEETGRFHNFMDFVGNWLDEVGSEDSHGRALWGLGSAAAYGEEPGVVAVASRVLHEALPAARQLRSLRAIAFSIVGIHEYLRRFGGDAEARRIREELSLRLFQQFRLNAIEDWPWPENELTYANGKLPQALLMAGQWTNRGDMVDMGMKALKFLVRVQKSPDGYFAPIGDNGWFKRDGPRALFDQLPIEAQASADACVEAWNLTRDKGWLDEARVCYEWFLGRNDLGTPLYDYTSGGCRDGLHHDRPNQNQGAESTLAYLLAAVTMEETRPEVEALPRYQHSKMGSRKSRITNAVPHGNKELG